MDGLTNIIAKIKEQNDAECALITGEAKKKADEILENARIAAEAEAARIRSEADVKVSVALSKAASGAEISYKRAVLSKKSEIISSAIDKALGCIAESPEDVYFGYIERLLLSNALHGEGRLVMSKRDKDRLPKDFIASVNKKLDGGKVIKLSDKTIDEYGFVIEYDEMKADCTFSSLLEDNIDEIRDSLNSILFA